MSDREVPLISDAGVTMVSVSDETLAKLREAFEDVPTFRLVNEVPPEQQDHDDQCESEFIFGPMAYSPCGCAERRGA